MNQDEIEKAIQDDETEICENCGNVFKVELLKEGEDWNDFGYRYCPFCGNMTDDYAAMYDTDGFIANAKHFLDDRDEYRENEALIKDVSEERSRPLFIIGNPDHRLGFMVASPDDPLGYINPAEAVSDLGQMRQDYGSHLKLYRVIPVGGPVVQKTDLEKQNAESEVENFDCSLIEEYIL